MKVNSTAKRIALALLLAPATGSVQATGYYAGNGACYPPVNCGYAPFECGAMNFEFKAGVAPKVWTRDRDRVFGVVPTTSPNIPFVDFVKIPRFRCLYKLPWTVGIKLGYFLSCNLETFLEFNYTQADARRAFTFGVPLDSVGATINVRPTNKLKEFSGFLGTRYYWNRWFCNTTSWFFGAKVGVTHHRARCFDFVVTGVPNTADFTSSVETLFRRHTSVAGGVHTGFDVKLWCGFSFVFTAEAVASCGPRGNQNIALATPTQGLGLTNISVGSVGTEVTFPITFGIQYTF